MASLSAQYRARRRGLARRYARASGVSATGGAARLRRTLALSDVDPTILQEIRYFTPHNFVGDPIDGYQQPMCILTREAAEGLKRAQQAFVEQVAELSGHSRGSTVDLTLVELPTAETRPYIPGEPFPLLRYPRAHARPARPG